MSENKPAEAWRRTADRQRERAERAEAIISSLRKLHEPAVTYEIDPVSGCWVYEGGERKALGNICRACTPADVLADAEDEAGWDDGSMVPWPCATVRALDAEMNR